MTKVRSKSIGGKSEHNSDLEIFDHIIIDFANQGKFHEENIISLRNNKIYLLNKNCQHEFCNEKASRLCNNVCGSFKGCGKYICEYHVKIFAEIDDVEK